MIRLLLSAILPMGAFAATPCSNDIPVRIEWTTNRGYCGETGLISAGLYHGQYMSQYDARALIGTQQDELLLGINAKKAADAMHLDTEDWDYDDQQSTDQFLDWVNQNSAKGYPVIIGVFINQLKMYDDPNPDDGDDDYDHIVPVTGFSGDSIDYTDEGLWSDSEDHKFAAPLASFAMTRQEANGQSAPIYSLSSCDPAKKLYNYGMAIKGVKDLNGETFPVRVDTSVDGESPPIVDKSNERPPAEPIVLTITVSGIEPNVPYVLYRYNQLELVPESDFNSHAVNAHEHWPVQIASGSTFTMTETIQSDEIAVYRAVKAP
ncbi:MAG TPA: hypothetical protein VLF94_06535 [Chlamydiales bacterium]|nr:hypothetical protein [Chlamydiales bacterium]